MSTPTPRTDARLMVVTDNDTCKIKVLETIRAPFARTLEREVNALTAERDQLRAQLHALNLVCGTTDADKFQTWVDRANARAARAEAAETVALAKWNGALERALKAEADLAAERARLDYLLKWEVTFHSREDIDRDMKEGAK